MHKKLVSALALLTPLLGAAQPARAGACSSAARALAGVWRQYGERAIKAGCAVTTAASGGAVDYAGCLGAAHNQLTQETVRYINKMSTGRWRSLGPRPLIFGEESSGTMVGAAGRMFITSGPSDGDEVTLTLLKRAGAARATVTICKVGQDLSAAQLGGDLVFAPGKDNVDEKVTMAFKGVKGHVLSVHIDSRSAANRFAYSLKATQK